MSVFDTAQAVLKKPDPRKRVNYTLGMVLGADEFQQEQAYLLEGGRLHNRSLHGYGTVSGLQVTSGDTPAGPEIRVSPGLALNPKGQKICISQVMCARLNAWLQTNRSALQDLGFTAPGNVQLVVVVCHRECLTDSVPVPSEPCRTQKDAMVASRITDSFELKLCVDRDQPVPSLPSLPTPASTLCFRPQDLEDAGVRAFGNLLRRITISSSGTAASDADIISAVRAIGGPGGPPPGPGPAIIVAPADAVARLRTLYRIWVTEIQPLWNHRGAAMGCESPRENCVLLAGITVAVNANWEVAGGNAGVQVDDSTRPILLSTRVLQEPLFAMTGGGDTSGAGAFVMAPAVPEVALVAAGRFELAGGGDGVPNGPTYNNLTATRPPGTPVGAYLLNWTQTAPYIVPPVVAPPYMYLVQGACFTAEANAARQVLEVLEYRADGILIRVLDTAGTLTASSFAVQITRIGAQP